MKQPVIVFVFGSNDEGRHGKGAAYHAKKFYGAKYGKAHGRQGNAYAICTKSLRPDGMVTLANVEESLAVFKRHATRHEKESFLLTAVGCGLAGFNVADIIAIIKRLKPWPQNVFITGRLYE